jgi:hypothetical protein
VFEGFPVDAVVNARRSCATAPWKELERDFLAGIHGALKKAALTSRPG